MTPNELRPVVSDHDQRIIEEYLRSKKPFFVEGGPGIGKSLTVKYFGRRIYGELLAERPEAQREPLKIDITEDTEIRHLLGEIDLISYFVHTQSRPEATKTVMDFFVPGPVTQAIHEGRLLIVEELDRAGRETLFPIFFDAMEYREVYVPELRRSVRAGANDFNIVFTVNRFTDIGTVSLPKALLRRARCVRFYDPSQELGVNRWQAARYETEIVLANVRRVLHEQGLRQQSARELVEGLLDQVIFQLRISGEMDEAPTPSETAMWFLDMFEGDGRRLLDEHTSAAERLEICLRYRCALVKSATDDVRFINAVQAYFLS